MGPGKDQGAVLLLVLVVTTVLAIVIGVILTAVEVNLRNTSVARKIDDKTYAADGGVEYTIQRLRQDATLCTDPTGTPWSSSLNLNGVNVDVSCVTTAGVATSPSNWAVVAGSVLVTEVGSATALIDGATYAGGNILLRSNLEVQNGQLLQRTPPCTGTPQPAGQIVGSSACTTLAPPTVNVALPQISYAPGDEDGAYTVNGDCKIFLPGKYTKPLVVGPRNYFASGIYYFENADINVDGIELFGGNRGASEMPLVGPKSACADDHDAGVSDGDGVEWILGGTSAISVSSDPNTYFELFSRTPGTSPYGSEGTAGVSIRSVPAGAPGYLATSLPSVQTPGAKHLFANLRGSKVGVHGLVYGPNTLIDVSSTTGTGPVFAGGVVAADLTLDDGTAGGPPVVSRANDTASKRFITITSTAQGGGASKNVTTTAVVELGNGANRAVVVDSWVTNQS